MEIVVSNLSVTYEKKHQDNKVLDGFSATFFDKKFNVVLGSSGCGKTTLLKVLLGMMDYEGEITYNGIPSQQLTIAEKNISYIAQEMILYPHMTIFDNIAFPLKVIKASREEIIERVMELSKLFDIEDCLSRKPKHLSFGQQQKVALARALVKRPNACLFDEPFSNLDTQTRSELTRYLKKMLKDMGVTVIYVTHDLKEAVALSDSIIVIKDKKAEFNGAPDELLESNNELLDYLDEDF